MRPTRRRFSAHVRPIVHNIEDVNANLEEGCYFFLDIIREGRLLYDAQRFELAEPRELAPEERQRIAQADFDYWFDCAERFFKTYGLTYKAGDWTAIFNLNQATESAYKTILLVFTGYCPHEHMLEWLGEQAAEFGPVFHEIFPQTTDKDRERFELLDRAYIGARYRKDFRRLLGRRGIPRAAGEAAPGYRAHLPREDRGVGEGRGVETEGVARASE